MKYFTLKFRQYAHWDNCIKLYISEIVFSIVNLFYFTSEIFKLAAKTEKTNITNLTNLKLQKCMLQ